MNSTAVKSAAFKREALTCMPLQTLHECTVAVQLSIQGRSQLLRGRAVYERDSQLGPVLRVDMPHELGTELVFVENEWNGKVLPGGSAGCDFLICLN